LLHIKESDYINAHRATKLTGLTSHMLMRAADLLGLEAPSPKRARKS